MDLQARAPPVTAKTSSSSVKLYAAACVGLGDYTPIIRLYRQMLAEGAATGTEAADLHLWLADLLKTVGRQPEAIQEYHAAIAALPDSGEAWWSLANLKTVLQRAGVQLQHQ